MENTYEVKLNVRAKDDDELNKLLDSMYDHLTDKEFDKIGDPVSIKNLDERHFEERIRYDENWNGRGEYYVFEGKWSDEEDWGTDSAFKLLDLEEDGEKKEEGVLIYYQALTKIRELRKMGVPFHFV